MIIRFYTCMAFRLHLDRCVCGDIHSKLYDFCIVFPLPIFIYFISPSFKKKKDGKDLSRKRGRKEMYTHITRKKEKNPQRDDIIHR